MGFLNDLFNFLLADSVSKEAGDTYFAYTLMRDDMESRNRAAQLEEERKIFEKQREQRLKEIKHLEYLSIEAKNKHLKAIEKTKESLDNLKRVYLSYLGCEEFEEMCVKMDLSTKESWDKLVDALPHFSIFNEDHEQYLKDIKICSDEIKDKSE